MGIGAQTDKAIAARLHGRKLDPSTWRYERRGATKAPSFSPGGSNNFKLVARTLDREAGRIDPAEPAEWRDPEDWLEGWYGLNEREGHDGFEFLSPVYQDAALVCAQLNADAGVPGATDHLDRALSVLALHRTWDGGLAHPGTRAKRPDNVSLAQWVTYQLGEPAARRPKPQRLLKLARALRADQWNIRADLPMTCIVSAPGPLVHQRHEAGFVSYFEAGPVCYSYPQPAAVSINGRPPVFVRPPYTPRRGLPVGCTTAELRTRVEGRVLISSGGAWEQRVDLDALGPVLEMVRVGRGG
jgi:hypothetical protein